MWTRAPGGVALSMNWRRTLQGSVCVVGIAACGSSAPPSSAAHQARDGWWCLDAELRDTDEPYCYKLADQCKDAANRLLGQGRIDDSTCVPAAQAWCMAFVPVGGSSPRQHCSLSEETCYEDEQGAALEAGEVVSSCMLAE